MRRFLTALTLALVPLGGLHSASAQQTGGAQAVLQQCAAQQKYAFLLFYRDDNAATRSMVQSVQASLAGHADRATVAYVSVTNPTEQAIIQQFGVARAPLPFVLAVAPNGAITALASQKISPQQVAAAFVTPRTADCLKAMQERKLVMVCVSSSTRSSTPAAVSEFQADPEFKDRIRVIPVQSNDPSESQFLKQMEIDPATVKGSMIVFMAPPAVLVGKFASTATKAEMASALHAAGKCCEDPNCKHNHGPQATNAPTNKRK
jgi:hypothetical protein